MPSRCIRARLSFNKKASARDSSLGVALRGERLQLQYSSDSAVNGAGTL